MPFGTGSPFSLLPVRLAVPLASWCWSNLKNISGGGAAGAGGGGFLLLLVLPENHDQVRAALSGMMDVPVAYEPRGARLLSVVPG